MPDDDRLDPEDAAFVGMLCDLFRGDAAESLLVGNDTGCFTTEQYKRAYEERTWKRTLRGAAGEAMTWWDGIAEMHLRSIPHVVVEVSPGVWAGVGEATNVSRRVE